MQQRLPVDGAVLGHEQEDQPIDDAQELAVEVGERHLAGAQSLAQGGVLRVAGEALAEDLQRLLDTAAQVAEGARALLLGQLGPLLQPAGLRPIAVAGREARGVGHEPEQDEIGIDLAVEHGLEVELQEGLARERLVVAQNAQAQAVGDDGPEVAGAAVQELLHQAVGIGGGGAAHPGGAAVEAQAAADQVDRHGAEEAIDGVGAAADLGAGAGGQQAEAQLAQQRQVPLVVGEAGAGFALGQVLRRPRGSPPSVGAGDSTTG